MWGHKSLDNNRALIISGLLICLVIGVGFFTYFKLLDVGEKISQSTQIQTPSSLIAKQMLLEMQSAENNARSYVLTRNTEYLKSFYKSAPILENYFYLLEQKAAENKNIKPTVDSIINNAHLQYQIIGFSLDVNDPKEITAELNVIYREIDSTYKRMDSVYTQKRKDLFQGSGQADSKQVTKNKQRKNLFKRWFGKKDTNNLNPSTEKIIPTSPQKDSLIIAEVKKKLKKAVNSVKKEQSDKLTDYQIAQHAYAQEAYLLLLKLNKFVGYLESNEKMDAKIKALFIKGELKKIRTFSVVFSSLITIILILLVIFIYRYIKKRNSYEEALIESTKRAEDLAKTKQVFLANMSHEIKTPLNAIYGFTEQILLTDLKKEQQEQLQIVKNSASYLTHLVNNILVYAKLQSEKSALVKIEIELKRELEEIKELFLPETQKKGIQLIFDYHLGKNEFVVSDLYKIKQILFNLLSNAIKFTQKGYIKLTTSMEDINEVSFIIEDTGIGIKEDVLPKLFNEFEQGDKKIQLQYGGTGLGLVIVREVIKQLGGELHIESIWQEGTKIKIRIPVEINNPGSEFDAYTNIQKPQTIDLTGKHILIVDDEDFNRLLIKTIIRNSNAHITEACNGEEAVKLVKEKKFDVIIMDIRMPVKTGIEATEEIRLFDKETIIIAATAVASEEKIARCMKAGVNDILFKPYTSDQVLEKLASISGSVKSDLLKNDINTKATKESISLANIKENFQGNVDAQKEMIQLFHRNIMLLKEDFINYVIQKDYKQAGELAHKVLPSCRHFEANVICEDLKFFDSIREATSVNETECKTRMEKIQEQIELILEELKPYI